MAERRKQTTALATTLYLKSRRLGKNLMPPDTFNPCRQPDCVNCCQASPRAMMKAKLRRENISSAGAQVNQALLHEFFDLSAMTQNMHDGVLQQLLQVVDDAPSGIDDDTVYFFIAHFPFAV